MKILLIAVFGLLGVFSRYWGALFVARYLPTQHFPLGTFIINIIGSFLIGVVYSLGVEKGVLSVDVRVGLLVGLLGGFTTFSSYALEGTRLLEQSEFLMGGIYLFGSPLVGCLAAATGLFLARYLLRAI